MKEKRDETIILRLSKTEKNRIYEKMFSIVKILISFHLNGSFNDLIVDFLTK